MIIRIIGFGSGYKPKKTSYCLIDYLLSLELNKLYLYKLKQVIDHKNRPDQGF